MGNTIGSKSTKSISFSQEEGVGSKDPYGLLRHKSGYLITSEDQEDCEFKLSKPSFNMNCFSMGHLNGLLTDELQLPSSYKFHGKAQGVSEGKKSFFGFEIFNPLLD